MADPAVRFSNVSRVYSTGDGEGRHALRDVSVEIRPGEIVSVVGRSGSGKSTFLHLAAGIDLPTSGSVEIAGREVSGLDDTARTELRRSQVGLVFQFFHLLPHLSVEENVALPEMIAGGSSREFLPRARELLASVGLDDRADDPVQKLSGGEQQRVAICRALLRRPPLLLADEPTGNLDDETGRAVMDRMLDMVREQEATLVYVTHSPELAALADRTLTIHSGALEGA